MTSPLGAVTATQYRLGTSENSTVVTSPAGVDVVTTFDVLGRTTTETLESFDPTTYAYDVLGNVTLVTDPAGIQTTNSYTNLSELTSATAFAQSGSPATTAYTYDTGGRLSRVDGPLSGADDDRISYGYDVLGRLTSVTYEGITLPGSTTKASVSIAYNDAGERIQILQPLTTSTSLERLWTYDGAGREKTFQDANGTTTWMALGSYVDEPHEARATQALTDAGTMRAVPPFGEIRL